MDITPEAFPSALSKGLGRAALILRQNPLTERLQAELLNACLNNLAYDPQCEAERGLYLSRLVSEAGLQDAFFDEIAARLETHPEEISAYQAFDILVRLTSGDGPQRARLRRIFHGLPDDLQLDCMDSLVRMDGRSAFIECADRLSRMPDESWRGSGLLDVLTARDGAEAAADLEPLITSSEIGSQTSAPPRYDLAEVRMKLSRGERISPGLGRQISPEEWEQISRDFATQSDPDIASRYLTLFTRRAFAGAPEDLLHWAGSDVSRVSYLAVRALSRVHAPAVRRMALARIRAADITGVRLLKSNYEPGDFAEIAPLFEGLTSDEERHELGLAVLDLAWRDEQFEADSSPSLERLYDVTPCGLCRGEAASNLLKAGRGPAWMIEECRYDADEGTVALFSAEA